MENNCETEEIYSKLSKLGFGESFDLEVGKVPIYNEGSMNFHIKYANQLKNFFMLDGLIGYTIGVSTNKIDTDENGHMGSIKLNFYKHRKKAN